MKPFITEDIKINTNFPTNFQLIEEGYFDFTNLYLNAGISKEYSIDLILQETLNILNENYLSNKTISNQFHYYISSGCVLDVCTTHESETKICMNLSEASLAKEWDNEDDSIWESYLN